MLPVTAHNGRFSNLAQSPQSEIPEIRKPLRNRHFPMPRLVIPLLGLPPGKATIVTQ